MPYLLAAVISAPGLVAMSAGLHRSRSAVPAGNHQTLESRPRVVAAEAVL